MSSATSKNPEEVLETYFEKYPDVPKEVTLKHHLLSLGHWFSDAALKAAVGTLVKSYRLFSLDLVPMKDLKRNEHRRVPEHFVLLGGPYGLRPVLVQTSLNPHSPYLIDVVGGRLVLVAEGRILADIRYPKAPEYYSLTLPNGIPYHEIVAFGTFITIFRNCQFWGSDEECKFCDINQNVRQMKVSKDFTLTAPVKSLADVATVVEEIGRQVLRHKDSHSFVLTGGTITKTLHGKSERDFYGEYISAVKNTTARPKIVFEVNARPPEECAFYKSVGGDVYHPNIEVWPKHLFEWINPGKASRIGYDTWIRWMCDAVEIFGEGNVQPSFVSGIEMARPHGYTSVTEAVHVMSDGFEFMMSKGIYPRLQQWRREPSSALCVEAEQPPVPLDFYILLIRNWYDTYVRHRAKMPKLNKVPGLITERDILGAVHGTHEDIILLTEDRLPPNAEALINARCLPFENLCADPA